MTRGQKIASGVSAAGVLAAAYLKFRTGEMPDPAEIMLAVSTIAAAFGFQRPPAAGPAAKKK